MISKAQRQNSERAGRRAETLACWYLRLKGYQILERRFKTKQGEIDIIGKRQKTLVMTEVKQRKNAHNIHETVSYENTQRIMNAAEIYLNRQDIQQNQDYELRFDIIHVFGHWKIIHIKDAFRSY